MRVLHSDTVTQGGTVAHQHHRAHSLLTNPAPQRSHEDTGAHHIHTHRGQRKPYPLRHALSNTTSTLIPTSHLRSVPPLPLCRRPSPTLLILPLTETLLLSSTLSLLLPRQSHLSLPPPPLLLLPLPLLLLLLPLLLLPTILATITTTTV
jgi:hypothetical protein